MRGLLSDMKRLLFNKKGAVVEIWKGLRSKSVSKFLNMKVYFVGQYVV